MKLFKAVLTFGIVALTLFMIILFIEYSRFDIKWTDVIMAVCAIFATTAAIVTALSIMNAANVITKNNLRFEMRNILDFTAGNLKNIAGAHWTHCPCYKKDGRGYYEKDCLCTKYDRDRELKTSTQQ